MLHCKDPEFLEAINPMLPAIATQLLDIEILNIEVPKPRNLQSDQIFSVSRRFPLLGWIVAVQRGMLGWVEECSHRTL
jgi:hypothetical protein